MGVTRGEPATTPEGQPAPVPPQAGMPAAGAGVPQDARVRQAELIIAYVLRGGVLLSAGVIVLGVLLYATGGGAGGAIGSRPTPSTFGAVLAGVARGDGRAVIELGLLILLATPVLRVAVSTVTFALERDWRYVAITAAVLTVLILSFVLGKGGA